MFLGVGIGVVDIGYERQLANHLGAHSTPSILGLINGKVTFFHYAVVREHLRQFVEGLLPQKLVEKVGVFLIIYLIINYVIISVEFNYRFDLTQAQALVAMNMDGQLNIHINAAKKSS